MGGEWEENGRRLGGDDELETDLTCFLMVFSCKNI
jgi:hypothetical protein